MRRARATTPTCAAALDASEGRDLPPELADQRSLLRAGTVARLGDPATAAALLEPLHTLPAMEARAQILENAGLGRCRTGLVGLRRSTVPGRGALDETEARTLLHLATATARAGDEAGLTALREKYHGRIGPGPLADMFRLLTAEPIRTSPISSARSRRLSLAASLPADLKALQAGYTQC